MSGNTQCHGKKSRLGTHRSVVSVSDLPEDVLARILSLLPMKDAVRTSVLSKWWEYQWALIYRIEIDDTQPTQANNTLSFVNFVDRILLHSLDIQRFKLSCSHMSDPCRLKIWMSSVLRRNIQKLDIVAPDCGGFTLPPCLLEKTSLSSLKLRLPCIIKVPDKGYLCSLKTLTLESVQFQNEYCVSSTGLLQLTFPVLKTLILNSITWGDVKLVEINSPALTFFGCMSRGEPAAVPNDFLIKVSGSRLKKFMVRGLLLNHIDLSASSVSSVVDAGILSARRSAHPFMGASESRSQLSIKEFSCLENLCLFGRLKKTYAQVMPGVPIPRFNRLQRLEMSVRSTIKAFLELLDMAPNLKQLIIETFIIIHDSEDSYFDEVGYVPSCMLYHLAEMKFSRFVGTTHELDLVKFLLKNSPKLQKAIVSVGDKPQIPKADIREMLSTYPKGSPCISVVFT